jgi:hypothetical protein
MFMRYRGGGVGHSSTREATNKFLHDRDRLDVRDGDESDEGDIEEDEIEDEHRHQGGSHEEDERRPQGASDVDGEDDVADAGHISGGDEADGASGDGNGFGGDEEDDYGYTNRGDDDDENSEPEPDLADDALGPKDGEGEGDETYLLGFAAL